MRKGFLGVLALVCLLLALTHDPASGTSVNQHAAADTVGLIVGHHHAKPIPATPSIPSLLAAVQFLAAAVILAAAATALVTRLAEAFPTHDPATRRLVRVGVAPRPGPARA